MDKGKILLIVFWIFVITALLTFGFALRFDEYKVKMTLVALVLWGIAYAMNRYIRNENKKKNQ